MYGDEYIPDQSRIELTEDILKKFFKEVLHDGVSGLAVEKDLPYSLVYNLANGRIRSLSARKYRIIFGEGPLPKEGDRVDGAYFRDMVKVWLFLNDGETKSGLYREFYPDKRFRKVDYRIFSGEVKTVEARLERVMEQKFLSRGFDRLEITEAIEELDLIPEEQRVPYESIKPALEYLEEHVKVSPARLLHGRYRLYERGELKTVSKALYHYALKLKEEAAEALHAGSRARIERLREKIYGKRRDFTLYVELEDQLRFLKTYGGRSPKRYLGRTIRNYEESKLKRVASWRAHRIRNECHRLINNNPGLALLSIPGPYLKERLGRLLSVLKSHLVGRMTEREGLLYEKQVLTPSVHEIRKYGAERGALTLMDRAAYGLEMSKPAFDLMVAGNRDIFRKIGHYDGRWHLPTRYLKGLLQKEGFQLIKEKYEFMARICDNSLPSMKQVSRISPKQTGEPARNGMDRGLLLGRNPGTQATRREGFGGLWRDVILAEPYAREFFPLMPDNTVENLNTQWLLYVNTIAAYRNIIAH
jgi:hypothetical protein